MKGNFVTNDHRLRAYRGATIEILNTFLESQTALLKIILNHSYLKTPFKIKRRPLKIQLKRKSPLVLTQELNWRNPSI